MATPAEPGDGRIRVQRLDDANQPTGDPTVVNNVQWFMEQWVDAEPVVIATPGGSMTVDFGSWRADLISRFASGLDVDPDLIACTPPPCPPSQLIVVDDLVRYPNAPGASDPPGDLHDATPPPTPAWESMRDRPDLLSICDDGVKPGSNAHRRRAREWLVREDNHQHLTGEGARRTAQQKQMAARSLTPLSDATVDTDKLIGEMGGFDQVIPAERIHADRLIDAMITGADPDADDDASLFDSDTVTVIWSGGQATLYQSTVAQQFTDIADRCTRLGITFDHLQQIAAVAGLATGRALELIEQQIHAAGGGKRGTLPLGVTRPAVKPNRAARRARPTPPNVTRALCHHGWLKGSCRRCWKEQR